MNRISIKAVVIAFFAELVADQFIQALLVGILARGKATPDMGEEEVRKLILAIGETPDYLLWIMVLGTGTTIGGGYLAARIAKQFPYYNGLGIGMLGVLLQILLWQGNPLWMNILALLSTIPASIYGAHLAKRHMSATE